MQAGQMIGPFAVEKELGAGAMGAVYLARYTKTGLPVAIKVIAGSLDGHPTALARFERESAILKKLNHPNIVRLYASGRVSGKPFYAMEFVEGESLDIKLERRDRFTWEEVVVLGKQICAALKHAHDAGVIHRDLKPANIMLTADGIVKLTDFGIAKALEADLQLTATNTAVGTASYMSPEQCRGERDLTLKSDLYSLGVMFYELLTGRKPFLAETTLDMFLAHVEGTFERPSRLVLDIPIWLDTLICQMLEKEPGKRPINAEMVAQALARVQEKVSAQRSAGLDVVSKRVVDRPRADIQIDEADKEAARLLRAGDKKKRLKRKKKPFYRQIWFSAAGILAVLLGLGSIVYLATRPPSAKGLFQRAEKLMASKNSEDWDKARDGPIQQYLEHYGDRQDEQAQQVKAWANAVDAATREHQLTRRMKHDFKVEGDDEPKARAALKAEEEGRLDEARDNWKALESYKDNPQYRTTGLLAIQRGQELKMVEEGQRRLTTGVEEEFRTGNEFHPNNEADEQAALALRYEQFGDPASALKVWNKMKDQYQEDRDHHPWALLANKKIAELAGKAPKGEEESNKRRELIKQKLEEAAAVAQTDPVKAHRLYGQVILLYDGPGHAEVEDLVGNAKKLRG